MALHRCAVCGSPNVVTDVQAGGVSYNYKKGIVGTVVLGAGGAAAGIENKTQIVYKCADCGMVLTYPMDAETQNVIDLGVRHAEARDKLKLYGISVSWDFLKNKYKNIEEGHADEMIRLRNESEAGIRKMRTDFLAEEVLEKLNAIQIDLAAYEKGIDNYDELQQAWEQASKSVLANRETALAEAVASLNADIKQQLEQLKSAAAASNRKLSAKEQSLIEEREILTVKLASLGLFKFAEKKATQNRIEEIGQELIKLGKEVSDLKSNLQKDLQALKETLATKKEQLSSEVEKKYPLAESPMQKKARLENIQNWFTTIKTATYNIEHLLGEVTTYAILAVMQDFSEGKAVFVSRGDETDYEAGVFNADDADPIFKKILPNLLEMFNLELTGGRGLFNQRLFAILRNHLPEKGLIEFYEEKYRRYYTVK